MSLQITQKNIHIFVRIQTRTRSQRLCGGTRLRRYPPDTVTVTQDLDNRHDHLDTHLDRSPELLVRNEYVDVYPLPTTRFQSQYYFDKTKC